MAVAKAPDTEVRVYLMADATACAVAGQVTPEGYYSIESMLKGLPAKKSQVGYEVAAWTPVGWRLCPRSEAPSAAPSICSPSGRSRWTRSLSTEESSNSRDYHE